jgi:hypothetical protein
VPHLEAKANRLKAGGLNPVMENQFAPGSHRPVVRHESIVAPAAEIGVYVRAGRHFVK